MARWKAAPSSLPTRTQALLCLLEDDSLVTKVSVESEQLLRPAKPDEVVAIIAVHVKKTLLSFENMSL